MKDILLFVALSFLVLSCNTKNSPTSTTSNPHVANADCANCHKTEQAEWANTSDLHSLSAADVLTNAEHNQAELLTNSCLKCHSPFQFSLGVSHFVTPLDQTGSPAGKWTALNSHDWQATKCEVCHNPLATNKVKLAKYGSLLDSTWTAGYINVDNLPVAYQILINLATGDTSTYVFSDQKTLSVQATKLCNSCHDPADEGGDPDKSLGGIDCGPQGGDSRAFISTSHAGLGCIDCHKAHTFATVDAVVTTACKNCHSEPKTGKVHLNHL